MHIHSFEKSEWFQLRAVMEVKLAWSNVVVITLEPFKYFHSVFSLICSSCCVNLITINLLWLVLLLLGFVKTYHQATGINTFLSIPFHHLLALFLTCFWESHSVSACGYLIILCLRLRRLA